MGTRKQAYQVFDTTLNRAVPFTYAGTASTNGIQTYMFTENIAPTQVATITVPGPFFGLKAKTVKLPQMYQIHLTYWVDPQTGGLLNVDEKERMTLRNPATRGTVAVLFDGDLRATPGTVKTVVDLDSSGRTELALLNMIVPLAAGIAGAVALAAGDPPARAQAPQGSAGHGRAVPSPGRRLVKRVLIRSRRACAGR